MVTEFDRKIGYDELKKLVNAGEPLPEEARGYDRLVYLLLTIILKEYKDGKMDRATASKLGTQVKQIWETAAVQELMVEELIDHCRKVADATQAQRAAYRLSPNHTPEADALCDALDGLL